MQSAAAARFRSRGVAVVDIDDAPAEPPEGPVGAQPIEETIDLGLQRLVQAGDRGVDLGDAASDPRWQVPAIREADRAGPDDQPTVAVDHQHQILGDESTGGFERMQAVTELDVAEPRGPLRSQVLDHRVTDFSRLGFDAIERREHGVTMLGEQHCPLGDIPAGTLGIGPELDPVVQVERAHPQSPAELTVDHRTDRPRHPPARRR